MDHTLTIPEPISYNSIQFGEILQNSNLNKIVCISWSEGDDSYRSFPNFIFLNSFEAIIEYILFSFPSPFILATMDDEVYTKEDSILVFDETNKSLRLIAYKNNVTVYQFYN